MKKSMVLAAAVAGLSFAAISQAAVVQTWSGSATGTWNTTNTNWSGAPANAWDSTNGANNIATFNTTSLNATVSGTVYANGITFSKVGTLSGGTINLTAANSTITTSASGTCTINSTIAGSGLTKAGSFALTLGGNNSSFSGPITLSAGTLNIGHANALGTGTFTNNGGATYLTNTSGTAVTLKNSSYTINNSMIFGGSTSANDINLGTGALSLGSTQKILSVNSGVTATIGGAVTGGLRKDGNGTMILAGNTTLSTGLWVTQGTLQLNQSTTATSGLTMGRANSSFTGKLVLGSADGAINASFKSLSASVNPGTLAIVGGHSSVSTLTIDQSTDTTYDQKLGGTGTNENNLALTKSGTGTLTISGTNTYTGATTVNGGTLTVNSSIASSSGVTVNGGKLNGTGTVSDVTLQTGGAIAGNLTTGNLNIMGTGTYQTGLTKDGTNLIADMTKVNGDVSIATGATLALTQSLLNGATLSINHDTWAVLSNDGTDAISGRFDNASLDGVAGTLTHFDMYDTLAFGTGDTAKYYIIRYSADIDNAGKVASTFGGNDMIVTAVPEPASLSLLGVAALGLLARRRRQA